mgnify:CR=1 FL=1
MDPDETLKRLRQLAHDFIHVDSAALDPNAAVGMGQLFEALDDCIVKIGFLPAPWNNALTRRIAQLQAEVDGLRDQLRFYEP